MHARGDGDGLTLGYVSVSQQRQCADLLALSCELRAAPCARGQERQKR
jgi:hypothetical protein